MQPWYLDAVAPGSWGAAVVNRGGQPAAAQPYYLKHFGPWKVIAMPPLCKFMGPTFGESFRSVRTVYKLSEQLVEGLPPHSLFRQNFHYSYSNWLPYYWKGFRETTRYSYVLEDLYDLDQIWAGLSTDYRNNKIPRAEGVLRVVDDMGVSVLFRLLELTYARQGLHSGLSEAFIERLWRSVNKHNAGRLLFAIDQNAEVHAAAFLLRDRDNAYLLLSADDPKHRTNGSGIWLIWQAIRYAALEWRVRRFDFLGSIKQSIEQSRRQFGAQAVPFHAIERFNSRLLFAIEWMRGRV